MNGVSGITEVLRRRLPPALWRAARVTKATLAYVPHRLFGTVTGVHTERPAVAVTFDDGPHPDYTPRFLELLERYGARGTFFVIGERAQRYPEVVRRIAAGGHVLGNHSWDHPSFPAISARERRRQIEECGRAIGAQPMMLFRPPYGNQTLRTWFAAKRLGWEVVTWSVSGTDWRGGDADSIAAHILRALRPGVIVLLHDALHRYEDERYAVREETLKALAKVLEAASRRFAFVTVPELLAMGRARREIWRRPGEADYLAALKGSEPQGAYTDA